MRNACVALAAAGLVSLSRRAEAQAINTEALRFFMKDRTRYFAIDGSLAGTLGSVDSLVAGGSIFGGVRIGKNLVFARVAGDYSQFGGAPTMAKSFGHVRYDLRLAKWITAELFAQGQQNKFERLELRQLTGIGPRIALSRGDPMHVHVGTAYMLEYERLAASSSPPSPEQSSLAHRSSSYLAVVYVASSAITLTSVTYVQPRFDAVSDVRVLQEASFTIDMNPRLKLSIGAALRHDSRPPAGVVTTNFELTDTLAVAL